MDITKQDCNDIFISYSSKDREWVTKLAKALNDCGYNVWWDQNLLPGSNFQREIPEALQNSYFVITIFSENSIQSEWVLAETSYAQKEKILIPVTYGDVLIPVPFNNLHAADLDGWEGSVSDTRFLPLLKSLKKGGGQSAAVNSKSSVIADYLFDEKPSVKNKSNRGCSVAVSIALSVLVIMTGTFLSQNYFKDLEDNTDKNLYNVSVLFTEEEKRLIDADKLAANAILEKLRQQTISVIKAAEKETSLASLPSQEVVQGVITLCSGGRSIEVQNSLGASLNKWHDTASAGSSDSLSDMGAIIKQTADDKIRVEALSVYNGCLKVMMQALMKSSNTKVLSNVTVNKTQGYNSAIINKVDASITINFD